MAPGMDLQEPLDRDLGVDGGRLQALVPEELLDIPDVGPALEHVCRAGMPEQVARPFNTPCYPSTQ